MARQKKPKVKLTPSWIKALSGLSINLSAGWVGAAFITPNFSDPHTTEGLMILTTDLVFAILSLLVTVKLESLLK